MSIFSTGAKVVGKLLTPAEKAASDFVKGKSNIIPSETKSGQTGLFMPSDYKPAIPKSKPQGGQGLSGVMSSPPFKGGGRFVSSDPRAAVTGACGDPARRARGRATSRYNLRYRDSTGSPMPPPLGPSGGGLLQQCGCKA
jgi:hypothetical protein